MNDLFRLTGIPLPFSLPFSFPEREGFSASWNERRKGVDLVLPGGNLFYAERFFNAAWSDRMFGYLQENSVQDWRTIDWRNPPAESLDEIGFTHIQWKQDVIKLYGKPISLPRLTAWYGEPGASYTYSGIKSDPNPWNDGLLHVKHRIENATGITFNSVLLNWYRDGKDSLNWHADDEKELGSEPVIASANFGATRDFQLRYNKDHDLKITIPLTHGTLLVMSGELQENWKHAVPKRANVDGSRFNMTFRNICC